MEKNEHVMRFLHTGPLWMPRITRVSHSIQHHQATGGLIGEAFQFVGDV